MLRNGQKLKKTKNVVIHSGFSLPQGCPLKIHIKTCHFVIRSDSVKKIGLPGNCFNSFRQTYISGGQKYLLFDKMSVTTAWMKLVSFAVFK